MTTATANTIAPFFVRLGLYFNAPNCVLLLESGECKLCKYTELYKQKFNMHQ